MVDTINDTKGTRAGVRRIYPLDESQYCIAQSFFSQAKALAAEGEKSEFAARRNTDPGARRMQASEAHSKYCEAKALLISIMNLDNVSPKVSQGAIRRLAALEKNQIRRVTAKF